MTARTACHDRLDAELYLSLHRGTPGDVGFYVAECRGARRVLELGSGYGRLSVALASEGHSVTGIELDPWLLGRARSRARKLPARTRSRLHFVRADMTHFDLGRRFDRIVIAHSTLYCLLSARELSSCLRAVRRHLEPDGVLLADAYAAEGLRGATSGSDDLEPLTSVTLGTGLWDVFEQSRHDPRRHRLSVSYVCRRRGLRPRERTLVLEHRYLLEREIEAALERAGFGNVRIHGGFRGERFAAGSPSLVIRAKPFADR